MAEVKMPEKSKVPVSVNNGKPETQNKVIVKGELKKESPWTKFKSEFLKTDGKTIGNYITHQVIVPAIKNTVLNIVQMLLFGKTNNNNNASNGVYRSNVPYVSYRDISNKPQQQAVSSSQGNLYAPIEVVVASQGDGNSVLSEAQEVIDRYSQLRVSEFFEFVGLQCPYTLINYGWTNINSATVTPYGDKWLITMPKAKPI